MAALLASCSGSLMGPEGPGRPGGSAAASDDGEATDQNGNGTGGPSGSTGTGAGTGENGTSSSSPTFVAAHIRKLSNMEYDNSVKDLLDLDAQAYTTFASDVRNSYYTSSAAQLVDETRGDQLKSKAEQLAALAVSQKLSKILPCAASKGDTCAKQFISTLGARAFRRPLSADEQTDLFTVFTAGKNANGAFNDGVSAVVTAVLQSASFLYVPELGSGGSGNVKLAPYEVASVLSYFVLGAPPDDALLAAAAAKDGLSTGAARSEQFDRLIKNDARAKAQIVRFVKEWLGIDQLFASSPVVAGVDYDALRPHFEKETAAFVEEVVFNGDASLATLLAADFTMADATLSTYYGLTRSGSAADYVKTQLSSSSKRRGLVTQGAFLSAHASRDHSSPVKRGVTIMRRLLCRDIQFPTGDLAKVAMQIPAADPNNTTRQRFLAHSTNPQCSGCHSQIDPLGFAFENFDQAGQLRLKENGKSVDATGQLTGTDVDGPFENAAALIGALSESETVQRCFARNIARFGSAVSSNDAENTFLTVRNGLPRDQQGNLLALLRAYVASDLFVTRAPAS